MPALFPEEMKYLLLGFMENTNCLQQLQITEWGGSLSAFPERVSPHFSLSLDSWFMDEGDIVICSVSKGSSFPSPSPVGQVFSTRLLFCLIYSYNGI